MTLNELLDKMKHYDQISVREVKPEADEIGEKQYYFGSVRDFVCNDHEIRRLGGREVKAIEMGLVSLIVGV